MNTNKFCSWTTWSYYAGYSLIHHENKEDENQSPTHENYWVEERTFRISSEIFVEFGPLYRELFFLEFVDVLIENVSNKAGHNQ